MVRHSGETERISAQHRHRCRRTPLRTADSGHRAGRLPDLPHALGTAPATTPAADSRWRPDWLRADADLRPFQRSGDTGRNGPTHHDPRGPGGLGTGHGTFSQRRHRCPGQSSCQRVHCQQQREDPHLRTRWRGRTHPLRRAAGSGWSSSQSEWLRPGRTGHCRPANEIDDLDRAIAMGKRMASSRC